jgi:G:T-mismatch repair DNA endonuclease (very short patch repair protein)
MKRDLRREEWFKENGKKLLIVWEDELNQLMIL